MLQVYVQMLHQFYLIENQARFNDNVGEENLMFGTALIYLACKTAEGVSLKYSVKHFVK